MAVKTTKIYLQEIMKNQCKKSYHTSSLKSKTIQKYFL